MLWSVLFYDIITYKYKYAKNSKAQYLVERKEKISMFKKYLSFILSVSLIFCVLPLSAYAKAIFPDVSESSFSWAQEAVEDMVGLGIIKGYTDGTFKPEKSISKIEALVLCARVLGYTEEACQPYVELSASLYEDVLANYDVSYPGEVSFLIYKDVIKEKELSYYIGGDNAKAPLKRYEAAKLLTKVMGAEDDLDSSVSKTPYADSADIPADAKPYVVFVSEAGLMNGMSENKFAPLVEVNRAQMATLLYRIINSLEIKYASGKITDVDGEFDELMYSTEDGKVEGISLPYDLNPVIKQNGYRIEFSKLSLGADVLIVKRGDAIYSIETIVTEPDLETEGVIGGITAQGGISKISIFPIGDQNNTSSYTISENVTVTYAGAKSNLASIKKFMYAELVIKDGKVIAIAATDAERTLKGTVESISLEPVSFTITLTNGTSETYPVADTATAKRNNVATDVTNILVGDKVSITLRYEQIAVITATSTKFTSTGTIEEITIATLPSIKIRTGSTVAQYSISRDATYTIDGAPGTIYDLRLNSSITASVDSETITSLTTSKPATSSVITGTIESINKSYGFFVLITQDKNTGEDITLQVFTKKTSLKVINSADGLTKTTSDLKAGMSVSVTGALSTGAFEATTIIILPD